jgi:hypothetical protein
MRCHCSGVGVFAAFGAMRLLLNRVKFAYDSGGGGGAKGVGSPE